MKMYKKGIAFSVIAIVAITFWWLLLEGTPPSSAPTAFDIDGYRTLINESGDNKPTEIRIEYVGTDLAPGIAAETGNFGGEYLVAYTSMQLVWPNQTMVIGGAVDQIAAEQLRQSKARSVFHQDSYDRVTAAMLNAKHVAITHAHPDHVMAIARHPSPLALAPRLRLNTEQVSALPQYEQNNKLSKAILESRIKPIDAFQATLVAPGVVVVPSPGHSPGSQSFFVSLDSGQEYLLIGDIVWTMSNIEHLKTRPRLLQYLLFDPDEDRSRVLAQVRALHDLKVAEPDLILVPSHDLKYLDSLIGQGLLKQNFILPKTTP